MKKATAILSALLVAVMMMAASVCAAEINLVPEDADWVMTEAGGSGASWSYGENGLTVKDNGAGWPNIAYSLETPLTVDVANATLSYKITNVNTAGNLAILITLSDTEVIVPHRLFTDEGIDFEAGTGYDSVGKLYTDEAKERLEQQLQVVHDAEKGWSFVGDSQKMKEAIRIGKKVAKSNSTVFLRGESGTGKEIMAKMIHALSDRRDKLMISINCAAIPENLVESELFGYEEGAFTGAKKHGSIGKFELAHGSTIFLDEIGDMPLPVQTKLLRVLQESVVERIGGTKPIPIDIRVICATNKNIEQMVEEGTFREDLYYRLNIIPIELPPLRKRKEDLPALIEYYIAYYNQKLGKSMRGVSPEALQTLTSYDWPGNVREMKNIIEYLENIAEGEIIQLSDLPDHIVMRSGKGFEDWSLDEIVEDYEKRVLSSMVKKGATLEEKNQLAENLKISRATLYRKLKKYDLL